MKCREHMTQSEMAELMHEIAGLEAYRDNPEPSSEEEYEGWYEQLYWSARTQEDRP